MALDRILHGGLPYRSEAEARADIAAKHRPLVATITIIAAYDRGEWTDADHRRLLSVVRRVAPALARRPSPFRAVTRRGLYGPTVGWHGYLACERRILWGAQQTRINTGTTAMLRSIARAAE